LLSQCRHARVRQIVRTTKSLSISQKQADWSRRQMAYLSVSDDEVRAVRYHVKRLLGQPFQRFFPGRGHAHEVTGGLEHDHRFVVHNEDPQRLLLGQLTGGRWGWVGRCRRSIRGNVASVSPMLLIVSARAPISPLTTTVSFFGQITVGNCRGDLGKYCGPDA
jgi:hypothetical protein